MATMSSMICIMYPSLCRFTNRPISCAYLTTRHTWLIIRLARGEQHRVAAAQSSKLQAICSAALMLPADADLARVSGIDRTKRP